MLTILGWLWKNAHAEGPHYTPEHAGVWARMIHRNLTLPHRFVVVTDTPEAEFDPLIKPVPLWDDCRDVKPNWGEKKVNCYPRLKAFSVEARDLIGERFVSIDLDLVVLGNDDSSALPWPFLDPLFDRPEEFVMLRRFLQNGASKLNVYQGSMWMMTAGARKDVWTSFKGQESAKQTKHLIGTDQAWITHTLGPNEAGWTDKDEVICWTDALSNWPRYRNAPPPVKMVFFNCNPKQDLLAKPIRPGETVKFPWIGRFYQ